MAFLKAVGKRLLFCQAVIYFCTFYLGIMNLGSMAGLPTKASAGVLICILVLVPCTIFSILTVLGEKYVNKSRK